MHCDCPYEDCQEEEETPEELETQEEEQPQTEVDLACASVQIVHAPPIALDNTPEIVDSPIQSAGNELPCPSRAPTTTCVGYPVADQFNLRTRSKPGCIKRLTHHG